MENKTCAECHTTKPVSEFYKRGKKSEIIRSKCKKCFLVDTIVYKGNNKEFYAKYHKEYEIRNKERIRLRHKGYKLMPGNKEKQNAYHKKRRDSEPLFKLTSRLRNRTFQLFKNKKHQKRESTEQYLGAPYEIVKAHIERQFKKGMNWGSHGKGENKWHIDHKIPLSSAKTEKELIALCHYTNLQPLWEKDNLSKNNKIVPTQMTLTI